VQGRDPASYGESDRLQGTADVGGFIGSTYICPIFDSTERGNFQFPDDEATRRQFGPAPIKLDPFNSPGQPAGTVRVLNILALEGYQLAENYGLSLEDFTMNNWAAVLRSSRDAGEYSSSSRKFINAITTLVRLERSNWTKSARRFVVKVTSPSAGQIIPELSTAIPIFPKFDQRGKREFLEKELAGHEGRKPPYQERVNRAPR
jgi:hypothetical protein